MADIAIILKSAPYGNINAAEAVRHALGALTGERSINLILVDGGVMLAKKGQDASGTGFTNLEGALKDCLEMGVTVYADGPSLKAQRVETGDLVEGVNAVGGKEIAELVKVAKTMMIF